MLAYSYIRGLEPPPRRPHDRCGETPSPLEKLLLNSRENADRITNSAGVRPAGTCICCVPDPTNDRRGFRVLPPRASFPPVNDAWRGHVTVPRIGASDG